MNTLVTKITAAIAHPARRVLTEAEAARYTVAAVLDGWNPSPKDA